MTLLARNNEVLGTAKTDAEGHATFTAGLTRACKRTNPLATCFGVETCQPDGTWDGCDALNASQEICDGLDNDCDGLTDQADDSLSTVGIAGYPNCTKGLTCTGLWSCRGFEDGGFGFQCSAPDPQQEVCNGADDDCNGQIDDGLRNSSGEYTSVRACGTCATDCFDVLQNLAKDAGVTVGGAATCELRGGQRTCEHGDANGHSHSKNLCAMGNRRPMPKAFDVTLKPGAACWRLYSLRSTLLTMSRTSSIGTFCSEAMSAGGFNSST